MRLRPSGISVARNVSMRSTIEPGVEGPEEIAEEIMDALAFLQDGLIGVCGQGSSFPIVR
jgi:hypothetical protein